MSEKVNYNQEGQQFNLKLFINDVQVPTKNIENCTIREWIDGNVLSLEVSFFDIGTFTEISPLYDECPVVLEYSKNSSIETTKIEFVMNAYETERTNLDGGVLYAIHFIALQKTKDFFYPIHSRIYKNLTSTETLKQICTESSLKFKSEVNSNDVQNWMQGNCTNYIFTKHLMKRSYIKEEDLPIFYFNRKNEAVYSSIKTKCNNKAKFTAINNDYAFMDNGNSLVSDLFKNDKMDSKVLYYHSSFSTKDISSYLNKRNGYGVDFTWFDFRDFYEYRMSFKFSPLTGYVNQNKNNIGKYVNGLTYNSQHKNGHKYYLLGMTQNLYIKDVFFNRYLQIMINPDEEVMIGDKINMIIYDSISREFGQKPVIDKVNSGEYIVGGILHNFKKDGLYSMILTLFRNGMNDSDFKEKTFELMDGDF